MAPQGSAIGWYCIRAIVTRLVVGVDIWKGSHLSLASLVVAVIESTELSIRYWFIKSISDFPSNQRLRSLSSLHEMTSAREQLVSLRDSFLLSGLSYLL
jgi:hypothetical protein